MQSIACHHPDKSIAILMYLTYHALAKTIFKPVFRNKKTFGGFKDLSLALNLKQKSKEYQEM
jgi:hypothetical protein